MEMNDGGKKGIGMGNSNVPLGIEVLVKKAAVDEVFRARLLVERDGVAEVIGLALDPAEAAILRVIPEEQLRGIIGQTVVPVEQRRVFLGHVAAAMLAVIGVGMVAGCEQKSGAGGGGVPDRTDIAGLPASTGTATHGAGAQGGGQSQTPVPVFASRIERAPSVAPATSTQPATSTRPATGSAPATSTRRGYGGSASGFGGGAGPARN